MERWGTVLRQTAEAHAENTDMQFTFAKGEMSFPFPCKTPEISIFFSQKIRDKSDRKNMTSGVLRRK